MSSSELKQLLLKEVDERRGQIFEIADFIYRHPEISLEEKVSSAYLADVLRKEGFEVEYPFCGLETAFKATKKNGEGPRICFMAEYDALPEIGHACGHHWIASTSVVSGIVLAKALENLPGEVTVFGTPAEETGDGKPVLVECGAFDGYNAALEIHGNYATKMDPVVIGIGGIDITYTGRIAHAGEAPWNGINALDAVIMLFNSINALRQQTKDGSRIHAIITDGGQAVNCIPEKASVRLEYRAETQEYLHELLAKILRCAEGAALQTGCELEWHYFEPECEAMIINKTIRDIFKKNMEQYPEFVDGDEDFAGGASDVGNVSQVIPTFHPMLKMVENGAGCHTVEFRDALQLPYAKERAVEAIKLMVETGLDLLENPDIAYSLKVK